MTQESRAPAHSSSSPQESSKNGNNVVDSKSLAADAAMEGKRQQTLSEPKSTKRIQITHKVPIKNSFHLVEIAPRCEKTKNRGMVMEPLQSLHRSPIQQIGIEGQIAFRVLSLLDLDHLTTCLHLFQM